MEKKRNVITAGPDSFIQYLSKAWQYRSLAVTFTRRDLRVKYAQTWLGIGWTLIQPIAGLLIFTLFFGYLFKVDTGNMPYPIFVYLGLTSWNFFTYIFFQGATSVLDNRELIKKVYFPKIILPFSKVLTGGVDYLLSLLILLVLIPVYGYPLSWKLVFVPLFVLYVILIGISAALWLSLLTFRKRDLYHIVPFVINFGIWLTPVFYTSSILPPEYRFLFMLNPMATVVEGFRYCLSGGPWPHVGYLYSVPVVLLLFVGALLVFRKMEDRMTDTL